MLEPERVLILGTTGVEKKTALGNLEKYQKKIYNEAKFELFILEDYILETNDVEIFDYLDADENQQALFWRKGWDKLVNKLKDYKDKNILLCMHAVLTRRSYGTRSPIRIESIIKDFKLTKSITLIDDVYLNWYRTHQRAESKRQKHLGKPTLEQLLQARRSEILLGDLISKQTRGESPYPPHYVISVWHPASVLDRIVFREPKTAYMAFPISKPRELEKEKGDMSGKEEINKILKTVADFESNNFNLVFFCPLTIDEYPLMDAEKVEKTNPKTGKKLFFRVFQVNNRWNVRDFYGEETILLTEDSKDKLPEEIIIPIIDEVDEINDVMGMIRTDVSTRDYRLIRQSKRMAGFDPVFETVGGEFNFSKGVRNEIDYALRLERPRKVEIKIYQNPIYDPDKKVEERYSVGSVNMGGLADGLEYIDICPDLETLLKAISI